jgi:hypothetical protein
MTKKQLSFYATKSDLLNALGTAASKVQFCYACASPLKGDAPVLYEAGEAIPDFSTALYGDLNKENFCLLISADVDPKTRIVEQRNGDIKYFFDQLSHPESVVLKPGGVMKDSECIIAGQIGSISQDQWSDALYKAVSASLRKQFTKIKSFYVGQEALEKFDHGFRLTSNIKSPKEYDLHR